MSNLLIDIGNTFSKIAVFENNELIYETKINIIEIDFIKDLIKDYKIKKAMQLKNTHPPLSPF